MDALQKQTSLYEDTPCCHERIVLRIAPEHARPRVRYNTPFKLPIVIRGQLTNQADGRVRIRNRLSVWTSRPRFSNTLKSLLVCCSALQRLAASTSIQSWFFPTGPWVDDCRHYTHAGSFESGFQLGGHQSPFLITCNGASLNEKRSARTRKSHSDEYCEPLPQWSFRILWNVYLRFLVECVPNREAFHILEAERQSTFTDNAWPQFARMTICAVSKTEPLAHFSFMAGIVLQIQSLVWWHLLNNALLNLSAWFPTTWVVVAFPLGQMHLQGWGAAFVISNVIVKGSSMYA